LLNKIDLKNVTFIIPVFYDSEDRKQNLEIIIKWLKHNFDTNIFLKETGIENHFSYLSNEVEHYEFEFKENGIFHKTKILNDLNRKVKTPYVSSYDIDILLPINQYINSIQKLNDGFDFVYPYIYFYRIPRKPFIDLFNENFNENFFINYDQNYNTGESYGGVYFYNKESFILAGTENENYISYGPEDWERPIRFEKLGFRIYRMQGNLYHINHWTGINSGDHNPYFKHNNEEFEKIKNMSKDQLQEYIKTWGWNNANI
jgi:hypothetical protein